MEDDSSEGLAKEELLNVKEPDLHSRSQGLAQRVR